MASNSEELLASDDMERISLVIESYIFVEPNDLETEFAATVSKMQDINSESRFMSKLRKIIWNKKGLNRHHSAEHGKYTQRTTKRDCLWTHLNSLWPLPNSSSQMINALKVWQNVWHFLLIKNVSKTFTSKQVMLSYLSRELLVNLILNSRNVFQIHILFGKYC